MKNLMQTFTAASYKAQGQNFYKLGTGLVTDNFLEAPPTIFVFLSKYPHQRLYEEHFRFNCWITPFSNKKIVNIAD